jgi:hypothetical protein
LATYKGGGFTQLLEPTKDETGAIIEDLKVENNLLYLLIAYHSYGYLNQRCTL